MGAALVDLAVAATVGGILVAIGCVAGFLVGRSASDPGGLQARHTVRELQGILRDARRRIDALKGRVGALRGDPRTAEDVRQFLTEHVFPLLEDRRRGGDE